MLQFYRFYTYGTYDACANDGQNFTIFKFIFIIFEKVFRNTRYFTTRIDTCLRFDALNFYIIIWALIDIINNFGVFEF